MLTLIPGGKAENDVIVVCKKHNIKTLGKDLGINTNRNISLTYTQCTESFDEILRGILIVIRVKLEKKTQKSHRINNFTLTDKKFSRQLPIVPYCWKIIYNLW